MEPRSGSEGRTGGRRGSTSPRSPPRKASSNRSAALYDLRRYRYVEDAYLGAARPANPITPWYVKHCDGVARFPDWHIFWRGLPIDGIEPAIRYSLSAPIDLA